MRTALAINAPAICCGCVTIGMAASAQAVTLEYDPAPSVDYAINDFTASIPSNIALGGLSLLTDDDPITPGLLFGRFLDPGLLDLGVVLNTPTSGDLFRLNHFEVVFSFDGNSLEGQAPQLLFTDANGAPQALNTTTTFGNSPVQLLTIEANFGSSDFLLSPGTTLTLSGVDFPVLETETTLNEVIIEGIAEPIPEPGSVALLALGGLTLLRRRR